MRSSGRARCSEDPARAIRPDVCELQERRRVGLGVRAADSTSTLPGNSATSMRPSGRNAIFVGSVSPVASTSFWKEPVLATVTVTGAESGRVAGGVARRARSMCAGRSPRDGCPRRARTARSCPRRPVATPSTKNCTPATPTLSDALAETFTMSRTWSPGGRGGDRPPWEASGRSDDGEIGAVHVRLDLRLCQGAVVHPHLVDRALEVEAAATAVRW